MRRGTLSDGSSVRVVVAGWNTPAGESRPQRRKMSVSVRCAAAVALLAIAFAAAGCGDTVIDGQNTEETLQKSLEGSLHAKIKTVDCPSDQKVEPGETF